MKKILAATDGSPSSDRAVGFAADCAAAHGAELLIFTVSDDLVSESLESMARAERATVSEMLEAEAKALLSLARTIANRHGVPSAKTQSETGDPASVLLDAARAEHADLIVVGKRGRGRLRGLLLGSLSQKLASLASCPVAIVP
jgi:nucleotide-binding universal stress UspA family protein